MKVDLTIQEKTFIDTMVLEMNRLSVQQEMIADAKEQIIEHI